MVLINTKYAVSVSLAKVYENCIKNINIRDIVNYNNNINIVQTWLPSISSIDVSTNEIIIRLKDEKEEINLGFTGYEWIFSDYVDTFYKEKQNEHI